jgi:hypothetical protein
LRRFSFLRRSGTKPATTEPGAPVIPPGGVTTPDPEMVKRTASIAAGAHVQPFASVAFSSAPHVLVVIHSFQYSEWKSQRIKLV